MEMTKKHINDALVYKSKPQGTPHEYRKHNEYDF